MKLQVALLAVGIAVSAGAVGAEFHRAANVASVTQISGATTVASQSSLKQTITASSKVSISTSKPTIKGGSEDD